MTDLVDSAQTHIEREMAHRLEHARNARPLQPTITCVHCEDLSRPGSRFCSKECLDEHEQQARQLKRSGRL